MNWLGKYSTKEDNLLTSLKLVRNAVTTQVECVMWQLQTWLFTIFLTTVQEIWTHPRMQLTRCYGSCNWITSGRTMLLCVNLGNEFVRCSGKKTRTLTHIFKTWSFSNKNMLRIIGRFLHHFLAPCGWLCDLILYSYSIGKRRLKN